MFVMSQLTLMQHSEASDSSVQALCMFVTCVAPEQLQLLVKVCCQA